MKLKILFVDDEPMILRGIERMLRGMRSEWDMVFAESGGEAGRLLEKDSFEVVVTDMRMPGMNGAELLRKVQEKYPEIVRIVLSGHSDQEMILKSVRIAHQYLSKPCDADTLKNTVMRALSLRELLKNQSLREIAASLGTLPSLPELYRQIMDELNSEDASMEKVAAIISGDVAMTAKVLQMVNSAFFGLPRHIEDTAQAVHLLGLETIKALVLSAQIFSQFETKGISDSFLKTLWKHSLRTAAFAKALAKEENLDRASADDAFLAGMLHDVGKLVLSAGLPDEYGGLIAAAGENDRTLTEIEHESLGTSHGPVGGYLMGLWGFGDTVVEAIAFHHMPEECPTRTFDALAAVHTANALEHAFGPEGVDTQNVQVNRDFLHLIGGENQLERWVNVCEAIPT